MRTLTETVRQRAGIVQEKETGIDRARKINYNIRR